MAKERIHALRRECGWGDPDRWFMILGAGLLLATLALPAAAGGIACESTRVVVAAEDPADVRAVCDGAASAVAFLARHRVDALTPVEVRVAGELPAGMPSTAVGCCASDGGRVYLLDYAAYAGRQRLLFNLPPDRAFYSAAAAHEVAHAMLLGSSGAHRLGMVAHEYVAYVAMFDSLPPAHRARLLALHPSAQLDTEGVQPALLLMLDPMRFGAAAYRHFEREPDPAGFLGDVLSGRALAE
jgi:hypothetical protein